MGTLKVGQAEEKLISEIEAFKTKYVDILKYIGDGLELAQKQLPNNGKGEYSEFEGKIVSLIDRITQLRIIIESIDFSEKHSEEKFYVSWKERYVLGNQYYVISYGKPTQSKEPVTQIQFVHAITSWEKEVCKSIILFQEIAGYTYNFFCSEMEKHVHEIVNEYVNPTKP